MGKLLSAVLLLGIFTTASADEFESSYNGPAHYVCGDEEYLSEVQSQYHYIAQDRQWDYGCKKFPVVPSLGHRQWHNDVNGYGWLLAFRCPGNRVITGVKSRYENSHQDRVFSFECGKLLGRTLKNCHFSGFLNYSTLPMDYTAPDGYAIVGLASAHHTSYEDRRWKAEICAVM